MPQRRPQAASAAAPSPSIDLSVFQQMADVSNEGMYLLERTGRILYVNAQAVAQMGGYTRQELLELTISDICPDVPPELFADNVATALTHVLPLIEVWTRRKDGTMFLAEVSMAPVEFAGDVYLFGVARDITERKATETARKDLATQLLQTIERERIRVARELHDDVGQALATIGVLLNALEAGSEALQPVLASTRTTVQQVTESLAGIVRDYHPAELLGLGLADTLRAHARSVSERYAVALDVETATVEGLLTPEHELHVYRIVQEALTNATRHAHPSRVAVTLACTDDWLTVEVRDDGDGFDDRKTSEHGVGLATMRDRALLLHGRLAIESSPGHGTAVRLTLPVGAAPTPSPPLPDPGPDGPPRVAKTLIRRTPEHADTGTLPAALDVAVFRQIADMSHEALFLTNADGRFVYGNASAADQTGCSIEELLTKSVPEINPDFPEARWQEFVATAMRAPIPPFETRHRRKDGSVIPVEVSAAHITVAGNPHFFAVVRDIRDRREAEAAARGFTHRLLHTLEAERRRVARELHDQVGQAIATVGVLLHALGSDADGLPEKLRDEVLQAHHTIGQITESVARIVHDYHPADLLGLGLEEALRSHACSFAQQHGLVLHLATAPVTEHLGDEQTLHVYRIVQEALANVARHAKARRVRVRLTQPSGRVVATVTDDGVGFDPEDVRAGRLGLVTMRERAALMHATLNVDSRPGHGTKVRLTVPATATESG